MAKRLNLALFDAQQKRELLAVPHADRIKLLRGAEARRDLSAGALTRADVDEKARTAWMSIASEEPYERWWGTEILDMQRSSVRDARLKRGLSILVDHDWTDLVGRASEFEFTPDKKLRVLARFGQSARAEEIFRDVLDEIRAFTSVGYVINDLVLERQEEDRYTYRVTDWEPLEGSIVAVPADITVGVGRDLSLPEIILTEKDHTMTPEERAKIEAETRAKIEAEQRAKAEADAKARAEVEAQTRAKVEAEQRAAERVNALLTAGDEYKDLGGPELARELIKDPNGTIDQFKARMLEKLRGKQKPTSTAQPGDAPAAYGSGLRTRFRYGQLRAFTRNLTLSDGTQMPAEEAAYRAGMWMAAALYQKDWAKSWLRERGIDLMAQDENGQVRVMSGGTLAGGGALVPVEMEQAIIDLRDEYGAARKLVRVRPMSTDQKTIPRRTGGVTAYFFSDDDGAGINASDKAWGSVNLVAKKLGALCRISEDLEEDAIIDVVDDLAQEMAYAFAVKEDQCFFDGDGTSTYGGITGIRTKFAGTAYASRITAASGHDTFAEIDTADLAAVMAGPAAYGKPMAKWVVSETAKSLIFDRLKAAAGGNDIITLGNMPRPAYLGYEIVTSEAMPSGAATDYTNLVMALFGRFDLAASMGNRRGITVQVLRERYAELGQIGIKGTERFDLNVHDLGSTADKGPVAALYGGT